MPQPPKNTTSFVCVGVPSADGKSVTISSCKPLTKAQPKAQAHVRPKKNILKKIEAKIQAKAEDCGCAEAAVCAGAVGDCLGPLVTPTVVDFAGGDPKFTCNGPSGTGCFESVRIDSSELGIGGDSYKDATVSVGGISITVHTEDGIHFTWVASGEGVAAVYAKGGQNGQNQYLYDGTVLTDCNLSPPDNENGTPAGISHIDFCVNPLFAELKKVTASLDTLVTADRDCAWALSVAADKQDFDLACGATASICYTIKAQGSSVIKNYKLFASLTINNGSAHDLDGLLTWTLSPDTAQELVSVAAGTSAVYDFEHDFDSYPGDSLTLSYSLPFTLSDGECVAGKTLSGSQLIDFTKPQLNDVCGSAAFSYTLPSGEVKDQTLSECQGAEVQECVAVGPYSAAGIHEFTVSASLSADCGSQSASATVKVNAGACVIYCIRSSGYWSTHASGLKYDAIWAQIGASGPDEIFYFSGKTYLGVMVEPSSSGAYYIAAQQFVATLLNSLMVAPQPLPASVQAAFDALKAVFESKTPAQVAALTNQQQGVIKANAKILDGFNTGTWEQYPECD